MRQLSKSIRIIGFLTSATVLLFAYTNCGKQKFSFEKAESFNPFEIEDFECKSMVMLTHPTDGSALVIPKRSGNGICYSVKLSDAVASRQSDNNYDTSVVADDHGVSGRTFNNYLRKLGEKVTRLYMQGPRSIKLSGSPDGLSQIQVDNIILVGIMPTAQLRNPAYYKAYGTEDCRVWPESDIGQNAPFNEGFYVAYGEDHYPVPVQSYGPAGTASVEPWRIDGTIEISRDYSIDYRGLDCGGAAVATDIYLTFE